MSLRVTLSPSDRVHFTQLKDRLVQEALLQQTLLVQDPEEELAQQAPQAPPAQQQQHPGWTLLQTKPNECGLQLYLNTASTTPTYDYFNNKSSTLVFWGHATFDQVTLEEAMYSVTTPTSASMLFRSVCLEEQLVAAKVLARITVPTPHEPFESLAIKWAMKNIPLTAGTISRPRDFVFLESTGLLRTTNQSHQLQDRAQGDHNEDEDDETIGYHLVHSVEIPSCHEFNASGIVRSQMSYCVLFRRHPRHPHQLKMFVKGQFTFGGQMRTSAAIRLAMDQLTTYTRVNDCVNCKKLFWMARGNGRGMNTRGRGIGVNFRGILSNWSAASSPSSSVSSSSASALSSSSSTSSTDSPPACFCHHCSRMFRTLTCKAYSCALCHHQVCRPCLEAGKQFHRIVRLLGEMDSCCDRLRVCASCWQLCTEHDVMEFVNLESGPQLETSTVVRNLSSATTDQFQHTTRLMAATRLRIQGRMPFDTRDLMDTKQSHLEPLRWTPSYPMNTR